MDAPVYKKLVDIDDHVENPFSSKHGQLPISTVESFWARLARHGRPWGGYTAGSAVSNTLQDKLVIPPTSGNIAYLSTAMLSCTVDAFFYISVRPNFGGNISDTSGFQSHCIFAKAGTPIVVKFDGEVFVSDSGDIKISCQTTNASETGKLYGSLNGIEVAINA